MGTGPTKTLAKSAQWASKEWPPFGSVLALTLATTRRKEKLLSLQPVEEIHQAICLYAERAAEILCGKRQFCLHISVFIKSSPVAVSEPYYGNVATVKLLTPTQDTQDVVAAAVRTLERIWQNGHRYAKAGVC